MEVGDKLKELNMTVDEIDRLTNAFKDEKFREMLRNYAQELSDPENKKRYEEELKFLEQERGNTIEFIHPEPFRVLRTSVNGKQKCFINICANGKVGKPASTWGVSEEGRRGQCWSLPHSLHPGRQDTDPKGNKFMIYDVIFHPDTLHIASKNKRFMDMVDGTAIQGIQNAFNVTLDKNNVRELSTKYKGTPRPCVIRKPIPGYKVKEPSESPDPLAFPYPDEKRPTTSLHTNPTESPATKNSSEPKSFQIQPLKTKEPTKPNHTVKYRSYIDLQDFRCSRDSAQSPRPKEIVVNIDVPLLKAVTDASLEVRDRSLLLESTKPAYRLELPLAYPVDEDKGEAKFNKQRGQLTVTLPVLPSDEAFDFAVGPAQTSVSDDERQGEKSEIEDTWKEEREGLRSEEQRGVEEKEEKAKEETDTEEDLKQQTRVERGEEEDERGEEKGKEQIREGENSKEKEVIGVEEEAKWKKQIQEGQESAEEEKVKEQKRENEKEDGFDGAAEKNNSGATSLQCDTADKYMNVSVIENSCAASPEAENQVALITAEHPSCRGKEREVNPSDIKEEAETTKETLDGSLKVETDAAFPHHRSSEAVSSVPPDTQRQNNAKNCSISQETEESSKMPAKRDERENIDEDDLPTEQIFQNPKHNDKPPPVLLREIDKDGNETVISDHSTSAGLIFQNSLIYELD